MSEIKKMTLVAIEDNELDLEKLKRGFKRLGGPHRLIHFDNAIDALDALKNTEGQGRPQTPWIVLLDLNLPRMSGFEFLDALRADPALAKTPVLVLTTSERSSDVQKAYEYNVAGYLVKPVNVTQMYETLLKISDYWSVSELPNG